MSHACPTPGYSHSPCPSSVLGLLGRPRPPNSRASVECLAPYTSRFQSEMMWKRKRRQLQISGACPFLGKDTQSNYGYAQVSYPSKLLCPAKKQMHTKLILFLFSKSCPSLLTG
ncbi:Hypothetical predicted protein [Podarcis lilfordi]|uniref:Uncharacterized protein n=1 Tax=Podarcis lilfordi TaxID=74358 RepID=A0AA35PHB3_9SAUR|nr:Hypothetical predicted protein [Podarcis lilfordi]